MKRLSLKAHRFEIVPCLAVSAADNHFRVGCRFHPYAAPDVFEAISASRSRMLMPESSKDMISSGVIPGQGTHNSVQS